VARRVVSLLRAGPGALRPMEAVLEANAYAVAEDVDLTLVLLSSAVELAIAGGEARPGELAGVGLPPAASAQDLRGLVESGVGLLVSAEALAVLGLQLADLVEGARVVDEVAIAEVLHEADAVLTW
jgi:intracellular sulfur oxidation DsrE/DsrF family protein